MAKFFLLCLIAAVVLVQISGKNRSVSKNNVQI